jgi:UvrD-like helicase C-terminal domain
VTYDYGELDEVSLAYAISIHKSQGSEFPVVMIPLAIQQYMRWNVTSSIQVLHGVWSKNSLDFAGHRRVSLYVLCFVWVGIDC